MPTTLDNTRPPRVVDHLARTLLAHGIDTIFGVPGGAIAPLYDALFEHGVRLVNFRHESNAVFAAAGAALQGRSVCVLVTSGPGVTNALTGIAAAHLDGLPVLVIAGEVPQRNAGRGALQDGSSHQLDLLSMVRPVTKMAVTLMNAGSADAMLRRALTTMNSGRRGPVFLSLPSDVASMRVTASAFAAGPKLSFEVDSALCTQAARTLADAREVVLVVGSGARHARAARALVTLAEALQCTVVTTPKGKGIFPEDHPLAAGVIGYGGHASAHQALANGPDVVLVVGSSLGETSTSAWSVLLHPKRALIQIDVDSSVIGRGYPVAMALVGHAEDLVPQLVSQVAAQRAAQGAARGGERANAARVEHGVLAQAAISHGGDRPLHPAAALRALQQRFGAALYTADIGEHLMFALHVLRIGADADFYGCFALGSMGTGIGTAVGAKLARPERPVIAVCGDWGFQMFGQELATCADERAGVVFAVMNDGGMRMVEAGFQRIYGRSPRFRGRRADFTKVAESVGARGIVVSCVDDILALDPRIGADDVPTVLDVRIDPDASFPQPARADQIGSFTSAADVRP